MGQTKKIVLLGAGYGGILTAKKLAKNFKKDDQISVTIIDKNSYHTMLTELHEVAAGRVPEEAIRIDLEKVFAGRKIEVVMDTIENIDFDNQVLAGQVSTYNYDYLVIGTGSKPTFFGCKGAEENAFTLWSYEDAVEIKNHILNMFRKASVTSNSEERKRMLTFTVAGCGFTGIEMIGELAEWRDELCKKFSIDSSEVNLYVVDMLPTVLPIFKDKLIKKTEKRLKKLKVNIITSAQIVEVRNDAVILKTGENIATNTVIWAAGVEGSEILEKTDTKKEGRNRVVTNSKLQHVDHENVFVVGDNIFFIPEGEERPVPQMVENAEHSSKLVAKNITAHIKEKPLDDYKPTFHGAMVCIGGKYGVAQVGTPKKQFALSGFLAMLIKHFINVIYFIQVAGFNKVWTYAMHEIFHVKNNRSFVGGHFSKASPNFFLVPIRLFLGFSWLIEGIDKLKDIIKDPSYVFLIPQSVAASGGASEAVDYGEALAVPGFIEKMVDFGMELMFYKPDGSFTALAPIFQGLMVVGEIVVGLLLIAGLFTALASIISIAMSAMIWASGMAAPEMLWYIFASVALIGGSGSTLGLDYYVLPFLKKRWKKIKIVKKWYIYTE